MALESLTAILQGEDKGLQNALRDVGRTSRHAARGLESVSDELQGLAASGTAAEESLESISSELGKVFGVGEGTQQAIDELGDEMKQVSRQASIQTGLLGAMTSMMFGLAGGTEASAMSMDELGDEMNEMVTAAASAAAGITTVGGSSAGAAALVDVLEGRMDELGEESREAAGSMYAASGAAEALSLSSSALSINVGAFTIALRNLTTQIPVLVTSLGGLTTTLIGVASAATLAAAGIGSVLAGGFLAQAEQLSGSLKDTEKTMQAMRAIGQEIRDMFLEAIRPLINIDGAVEAFKNAIEGLATTVHNFSSAIAEMFSSANDNIFTISELMDDVGSAWMDNLQDITRAFMVMFDTLGPLVSSVVTSLIDNFDEFLNYVTLITRDMAKLFGQAGGSIKDFIQELIRLGINIAAGIVPVVQQFISVVADVASVLNEINQETGGLISKIAKVAVLLMMINKLAGAMGALIAPVTAGVAAVMNVYNSALKAGDALDSMTKAVTGMTTAFSRFLTQHIGGFSTLARSLGVFESNTKSAAGALSLLNNNLDDDVDGELSFLGDNPALRVRQKLDNVQKAISSKAIDFGNLFTLSDDDMDLGFLGRMRARLGSGLDNISSMVATKVAGLSESFKVLDRKEFERGLTYGNPGEITDKYHGIVESAKIRMSRGFDDMTDMADTKLSDLKGIIVSRIAGIKSSLSALRAQGFSGTFDGMLDSARSLAGTQTLAAKSSDELADELIEVARISGVSGEQLSDVDDELQEMAADGKLSSMSIDELQDEMVQAGVAAEWLEEGLEDTGDELTKMSLKATVTSAIMGVLSGASLGVATALTAIATAAAAIAAAFAIIVVAGGAIVALLASLNKEGQSAEDIMQTLTDALRRAGEIVMPMFVDSANMIMDVLNSIWAPINQLIVGFQEIAIALGFMDEKVGAGQGSLETFMGLLQGLVNAVEPIMDTIGLASRVIGGELALAVRGAMDALKGFLVAIDFGDMVRSSIETTKELAGILWRLLGAALEGLGSMFGDLKNTLGVLGRTLGNVMGAFSDALNLGGGGAGFFSAFQDIIVTIVDVLVTMLIPIIDIVVSLFGALMGVINVLIIGFGMWMEVIAGLIGLLVDVINLFLGWFNMDLGSLFDGLIQGIKIAAGFIADLIGGIATVIDFAGRMASAWVQAVQGMFNAVAGLFSTGNWKKFGQEAVQALINAFSGIWNDTLGGFTLKLGGHKIKIGELPTAGGGGDSGGAGGGVSTPTGATSAASDLQPEKSEIEMKDAVGGMGIAKQLGERAASEVGMAPTPKNIEYNEGDVNNNYQQNIDANPEDKGTMKRVVKDAMEEANSFERRRQGHMG